MESGLNDGICVPILLVFLSLAEGEVARGGTVGLALRLVAEELGLGILVGCALAWTGAHAIRACATRGWITQAWSQIPVIALAFACYAVAEVLGGSGFIGCFVGGMLFDRLTPEHKSALLLAAEGVGGALALVTWVVFGAGIAAIGLQAPSWSAVVYAVACLTIVRMLPVFLSLTGLGMGAASKLFVGWFGPRGLASIVFVVIVLDAELPGSRTMATVVAITVCLSIVAHGLSALPLSRAFARSTEPGSISPTTEPG